MVHYSIQLCFNKRNKRKRKKVTENKKIRNKNREKIKGTNKWKQEKNKN
jgi:hypothetical protein